MLRRMSWQKYVLDRHELMDIYYGWICFSLLKIFNEHLTQYSALGQTGRRSNRYVEKNFLVRTTHKSSSKWAMMLNDSNAAKEKAQMHHQWIYSQVLQESSVSIMPLLKLLHCSLSHFDIFFDSN